jgi:hypothetical protein
MSSNFAPRPIDFEPRPIDSESHLINFEKSIISYCESLNEISKLSIVSQIISDLSTDAYKALIQFCEDDFSYASVEKSPDDNTQFIIFIKEYNIWFSAQACPFLTIGYSNNEIYFYIKPIRICDTHPLFSIEGHFVSSTAKLRRRVEIMFKGA